METPRTIEGQAVVSGLRPHLRRAFARTIVAIEDEAAAPFKKALMEADAVLADLATRDPSSALDPGLQLRAAAAHERVKDLLAP